MLGRPVADTLANGAIRLISPAPTSWRDTSGWKLVVTDRITGEEQTESEIINPQSIALDEAGRLYVADQNPAVIKVYDRAGNYLRSIGREGAGPGEFRVAFIETHGPHLIVHDPQSSRTSVFDTAGTFLRSWTSSCCYWSFIGVDSAGLIYIPTSIQGDQPLPGSAVARFTTDGTGVDTLFVAPGEERKYWMISGEAGGRRMMMGTSVPFTPGMIWTTDLRGGIVYGWSGDYQLVRGRTGRDTLEAFGRTWTPDPITGDRKHDTTEAIARSFAHRVTLAAVRAQLHEEDIPDQAPAFSAIRMDRDGNTWVRLDPAPGRLDIRYDVFGPNGWYLGQVSFGSASFDGYAPQFWGHGEVAVAMEDAAGRPVVVRYQVQR